MKRLLTLVSLLVPLTLPAQKRDNFFTDLNDFLNMRADKAYAKMDTSYIDRYPFIWDARTFFNTEGLHLYTKAENTTDLSTGMTNRAGISIGYRGLALSFTRALGRKMNFGLGLSSYGSHIGFEYNLRVTSQLSGHVGLPDGSSRIASAGDLTLLASNLNVIYSFNRRFSYAAAMKQSKIQRRSAGSFIAAASWTVWDVLDAGPDIISTQTSVQTFMEVTNVMYNRFSIGAGYGYNLVLGRQQWLLHASLIPMWTFFDSTRLRVEGNTTRFIRPAGRIGLTGTARAGIYYRWGTRWSIGLSGVINQMSSSTSFRSDKDGYQLFAAQDWQARLSLGFRF